MKRWYLLILIALLGLSACTVTVTVNEIKVTANKTVVGPGEAVALTATPNFETSSRILWNTGSKDTREPGAAFSNDGVGREVTYTAPQAPGVYTVIARSADEVSINDSIEITVDEFLGLEPVEAGTDLNASVAAGSIAAGEEKLFLINVSSAAAATGLALYIELNAELDLTVLNNDRTVYATSSSADFFAAGTAGLSSLAPQAITNARQCRGSCVIRDASAGNQYVKVKNTSSSTVPYTLYAYVTDYSDSNEAVNDAAGTAVALGAFDNGALESLGDEDYYLASKNGKLCFGATSWSNARVNVTNVDGVNQILAPGESTSLRSNDLIRVYELEKDAAAAATVSGYVLEILESGSSCG